MEATLSGHASSLASTPLGRKDSQVAHSAHDSNVPGCPAPRSGTAAFRPQPGSGPAEAATSTTTGTECTTP